MQLPEMDNADAESEWGGRGVGCVTGRGRVERNYG